MPTWNPCSVPTNLVYIRSLTELLSDNATLRCGSDVGEEETQEHGHSIGLLEQSCEMLCCLILVTEEFWKICSTA